MGPENGIALLCTLYPASAEKREKILTLLRHSARDYYILPSALCTTWCYFTPINPSPHAPPIIGGLEMYTDKKALQRQVDDKEFFQRYHNKVKEEGLYAREEVLQGWYFHSGFMTRQASDASRGKTIVSITKFSGQRDKILDAIGKFIPFVKNEESGVLTYAVFARPKAEREVLVFARYADGKTLGRHGEAEEHAVAVEEIRKYLDEGCEVEKATTLWREVEDSFLGDVVDGGGGGAKGKEVRKL